MLLHELTHYTSHESRCNRQLGKRFGDDACAMEELSRNSAQRSCAPISASPMRRALTMRNVSTIGSPS